jgi:hypothetical protein
MGTCASHDVDLRLRCSKSVNTDQEDSAPLPDPKPLPSGTARPGDAMPTVSALPAFPQGIAREGQYGGLFG